MSLRDIPLADADCQGQLNWCSCTVIDVKEKLVSLRWRFLQYKGQSHGIAPAHTSVQSKLQTQPSHTSQWWDSHPRVCVSLHLQIKHQKCISKWRLCIIRGKIIKQEARHKHCHLFVPPTPSSSTMAFMNISRALKFKGTFCNLFRSLSQRRQF